MKLIDMSSCSGCESVESAATGCSSSCSIDGGVFCLLPPQPLSATQASLSRFGNALKCATCFMTSLCDFLFISSPLSLSHYRLYCGLFLLNFPHKHTHAHTHTNTIELNMLARFSRYPFHSVCLSRFNKRNLSNSNARKCLSQPRQAVCLPFLLPSLPPPSSCSSLALSVLFCNCLPDDLNPFPIFRSVLPLMLANHIVCSTEISQFNEFHFSFQSPVSIRYFLCSTGIF